MATVHKTGLRLLRVTGKGFVAGTTFDKDSSGTWRCVRAAPILRWIKRGMAAEEVQAELKKRGLKYEWV